MTRILHRLYPFLILLCLAGALLVLMSCWSSPPPVPREVVPAAQEAERLRATDPPAASEVRDLRARELAADTAAAQAIAAGDLAKAEYQKRLGDELARLRVGAEQREMDQHRQIAALAAEADLRAVAERDELDRREAAAAQAADRRLADEQRQRDRRWAGWGLALAVAAGIALRILGLPTLISGGIPAAIGAGCLTLAAWSSVPWLATVLGIVLAGGLVIALAVVARHLVTEWADYADRLGDVHPNGKVEADAASIERQPAWIRWIIDHLLSIHAASKASSANPIMVVDHVGNATSVGTNQ